MNLHERVSLGVAPGHFLAGQVGIVSDSNVDSQECNTESWPTASDTDDLFAPPLCKRFL